MITRIKRNKNYSIVNNAILNDKNLGWKEVGLLIYLLSKPDNWNISVAHLVAKKKMGQDGIYSALKVIRSAGYASYSRNSNGTCDWLVFDEPQDELIAVNTPPTNNPVGKNPRKEKPHVLISTERAIITERSTKTLKKDRKQSFTTDSETKKDAIKVAEHLYEKIRSIQPSGALNKIPWVVDIEKAIRIDMVPKHALIEVIDWIYSPNGSFWQANVLSGKKLRSKYLAISIQMNTKPQGNNYERKPKISQEEWDSEDF